MNSVQDLVAPLEQVLNDGTTNLVYGLTRIKSSTGTWYQHDGVGSVRATLDGAGAVQSTTSYDPWGTPQTALADSFGFTGELQFGEQVHLRARWYNTNLGTFTSRDPFKGFDTLPYSLHPYQYAYSNPVLLTDPSGRVVPDEPGPPITSWDAFQNRYGYFDLRATPEDWERLGYTPQDATRYAFAYERYLQNPRAFIAQHPPGTWSYADAQLFAEHFLRRYFQSPVEMAVEEELLAFFDRVGTDPWTAEDRQCYIDLMIPFGFFNYEPMYGPFGKGGGGGGGGVVRAAADTTDENLEIALRLKRRRNEFRHQIPEAKDWEQLGLDPVADDFADKLYKYMHKAKTIHFDLTDMRDINGPNGVLQGPIEWNPPGSANWELRTIWDKPVLKDKTKFYLKGKEVTLAEVLQIP